MTDRELLEKAAKAAGVVWDVEASKPHPKSGAFWGLWLVIDHEPSEYDRRYWNPLTDDGDALRLAVKLRITLGFGGCSETVPANVVAHLPKKPRWWASNGPHWVRQEYVPEEMWSSVREYEPRHADWCMQEYPGIVRGLEAATRLAITRAAASLTSAPAQGENHG